MHIDVTYDYTRDVKNFWEIHWRNNPRTGKVSAEIDPDGKSQRLKMDQYSLYRRELPNGEFFDLWLLLNTYKLVWNGETFGSDSIIVSFRRKDEHADDRSEGDFDVVDRFAERDGYREWVERYLRESYTIGGEIIFPTSNSINQAKGMNMGVADRFDLTLWCIQCYYEKTPADNYYLDQLVDVIKRNAWFFDKFINFRGYVDFFLLQDCVDEDYNTKLFLDHTGRPNSVEEYEIFMDRQMEFLRKRNKRIAELELKDKILQKRLLTEAQRFPGKWIRSEDAYRVLCPDDPGRIGMRQRHRAIDDAVREGWILRALE